MTDLVSVIREEHRAVLRLAEHLEQKYRKWPLGEHAAKKALHELVALEARHEAAEARYLWPVVRDVLPEYAEIRATAQRQESQARWQLHRLYRAAGTEASVEMVPETVQALRIHVGLEESQVLAALESALSRNDSLRLAPRFERASALGPTRPHPRTPPIPGVLAAVAPIARRTDRLRDLLRLR